ncbi:hypothetical protein [Microbacterium trichothecenolyticum]|uniref:PLL-like beta propeller domain-containing protein n=1 Tax=Microbacterium trichothecenolyticum TaxID=69370 RepID=A0A0M2HE90_MICTR|nr:hypothetical protein [Microbacterium trichothecenolyticum]KJL42547.1 hypothetical protein RS82_02104 [Microbacterium trichothecenolyticum]
MAESWTIRLERLFVDNADEDDFWSDGDEPYIVMVGFRSKFLTPGSTSVFWSGVLNDDWANGIDSGESKAVPANQGAVRFDDVTRPTAEQVKSGQFPELLGALVLVFESDATPFSAVRGLINDLVNAVRTQLKSLVEGGKLSLTDPKPDIDAAVAKIRAAIEPDTLGKIGLFLRSWGDPDDLIGMTPLIFAAVDTSMGLPIPVVAPAPVNLTYTPSGVKYRLTGSLSQAPTGVGWESLGGGLNTGPAAASWGPGRLDVVAAGTDNAVWHKWFDGSWHNWESLGGIITADPAISSWGTRRLDIFARGTDNALWHKWFDGSWHDWESLGGGLSSGPAAASWGPGRVDVFVRGTDNALWHKWFDGGWSGWESLGGGLTSDPAVASWGPGRLDVFVRGTDNALWHKWFDGGWSGWESLGGVLTSSPGVAAWGPGRLDVVVRGTDNACWHKWFENGWSGWETLGGGFTSSLDISSWGPRRLDIVGRGNDGALWHSWFDNGWS